MKHLAATAGAAGAALGLVAGVGSTTLLSDSDEPTERIVQVPVSADQPAQPEQPDPLVGWLKQHPRNR